MTNVIVTPDPTKVEIVSEKKSVENLNAGGEKTNLKLHHELKMQGSTFLTSLPKTQLVTRSNVT